MGRSIRSPHTPGTSHSSGNLSHRCLMPHHLGCPNSIMTLPGGKHRPIRIQLPMIFHERVPKEDKATSPLRCPGKLPPPDRHHCNKTRRHPTGWSGPPVDRASTPQQAMIEDSVEEYLTVSSGEEGVDHLSPKWRSTGASLTPLQPWHGWKLQPQ
jgi:hypothetical protein